MRKRQNQRRGRTGQRASAPSRRYEREQWGRRLWRRIGHAIRYGRVFIIGGLFVGMLLAFVVVLSLGQNSSVGSSNGIGQSGRAQGQTSVAPQWVTLNSTTPAGVLAAARETSTFQEVASSTQTLLGQALHSGALGTPVLVHAYHPTPGMLAMWVIPVLESTVPGLAGSGPHVVALLDFAYDATHHRLHAVTFAGPFVPSDPEYGQPFPRYTAQQALAAVTRAHGQTALRAGAQPELVYFPVNLDQIAGPNATIQWAGGGQFADLAVWVTPGATGTGNDYVLGIDGRVYSSSQLPITTSANAPS